MIDIHLPSKCVYKIDPPSYFGSWISWYGKIPRFVLKEISLIKQESDFEIVQNCKI